MEWTPILLIVLGFLAVGAIGFAGGVLYRKKERLLEAKDEIHKSSTEHDREVKERRA